MKKVVSLEEALDAVKDGMSLMVGGFLGVGTPEPLIDELRKRNVQNLTVIGNDSGYVDKGVGKLIANRQVTHTIASHIGTNAETGRQMHSQEMQVELVPQGTLAERIRCAGMGLGGVLTPTGIGTVVEEGKQKITVKGQEYLLEEPLKADIALIQAAKADKAGNLLYSRSARNFNPLMAMAADIVIVYADELVEIGEIDPDQVMTPGIFVTSIVAGGK